MWLAIFLLLAGHALGDVLAQGLFQIQYAPRDASTARDALAIVEQGTAEFASQLPAGDTPIRIIICTNTAEFERRAGAYGVPNVSGIARPDKGLIVVKAPRLIQSPGDFTGVLRHELAHVLLARNTNEDHLPRWLNEGIAMILSKENRWNSVLRVAQMQLQGRIIPYRDMVYFMREPGEAEEFGDAYAQSLLMTIYLRDALGDDTFWTVVRAQREMSFGDAMRLHAHLNPPDFFEAWRGSLWKYSVVFWIISGFGLFQIMAVLAILAYMRKQRLESVIFARWDEEDGAEEDVESGAFDSADNESFTEEDEEYL